MIFLFQIVISLSCPIQCCFVALHDYDNYCSLVGSILLAFAHIKRNSACLSKLLFKLVIPLESTIPSYMWYLPTTPNLYFLVPSRNLFKSFPFVTIQAHGLVRENQYLPCQRYFDGSFNQSIKNMRVTPSPYLMME